MSMHRFSCNKTSIYSVVYCISSSRHPHPGRSWSAFYSEQGLCISVKIRPQRPRHYHCQRANQQLPVGCHLREDGGRRGGEKRDSVVGKPKQFWFGFGFSVLAFFIFGFLLFGWNTMFRAKFWGKICSKNAKSYNCLAETQNFGRNCLFWPEKVYRPKFWLFWWPWFRFRCFGQNSVSFAH